MKVPFLFLFLPIFQQIIEVSVKMSNIVVYRTHIEITDYKPNDCPQIEKIFSVYDTTRHRYLPKGRIYDKKSSTLMLPRGIDINFLERIFCTNAIIDQSMDLIQDIYPVNLKYKPRDEIQKKAISFMLGINDYKGMYDNCPMMSVNLNTGKGKTYCAIATAAYLALKTAVITDNVGWLDQWKRFFLEYTDIDEKEIYQVSGTPSIMKLYKRDPSKYKVILFTHATLKSFGDSKGWQEVSKLFNYLNIGLKFFDEAHLDFDNMFQIDCYTNTYRTYYLTATPGRSDMKENDIFGIYFQNVPSIDLYDKERDAHTRYAAIRFNSNPTPVEASACSSKKYGLDRIAYADYLVRNENFHKLLYILVDMAIRKPGKHLFYVGTNEAILYIKQWIYDNFPELVGCVGVYTSIVPANKRSEELNRKIILSTTKSAGAAMDIKDLVETVNLAEPFKSRVLAQQTFGRTRNNGTLYKDIVDTGFYYTKKFYDFKKPVFDKYATECIEINIKNDELTTRSDNIIKNRENLIQPMEFSDN